MCKICCQFWHTSKLIDIIMWTHDHLLNHIKDLLKLWVINIISVLKLWVINIILVLKSCLELTILVKKIGVCNRIIYYYISCLYNKSNVTYTAAFTTNFIPTYIILLFTINNLPHFFFLIKTCHIKHVWNLLSILICLRTYWYIYIYHLLLRNKPYWYNNVNT